MTEAATIQLPPTGRIGVEDLHDLMASFHEVTAQLQATHTALQAQVGRLQLELAEANAQLRRSRSLAALGEMAAGIAHEIRNPLGSIQLYAQILADDVADRPDSAKVCGKIDRAVQRLDAIVGDVLSFARDTIVRPQPIEVRPLIEHAVASCEALLREGGIEVEVQHEPGARALTADPGLLSQALANVLRNAIEAMMENGKRDRRVLICASAGSRRTPDGQRVPRIVLAVEDSGPGLSEDVVQRMFNPFFTTRPTGTGLGLAIVHRIIDAHGGEVGVGRSSLNGARVELCLPPRPARSAGEPQLARDSQRNEAGETLSEAVRRRIQTEPNE